MTRGVVAITIFLSVLWFEGTSQDVYTEFDCATTLTSAENEFGAGRFYSIPALLKECIDRNQFSDEEKLRVYMLLTQVYLLTDDPAMAEVSYMSLLSADPEFVASEDKDPIDVVYLSKKFTTTPIFTPYFKLGGSLTTTSIIYSITTEATDAPVKYTVNPGLTLGAGMEWNINDNLGAGGEVLLSYKAFTKTITEIFGGDRLDVIERQYWADFPLYLRYGYHLGKYRPYAYAGGAFHVMVADRAHLEYLSLSGDGVEGTTETPVRGPNIAIEYKRNRLNGSMVFGGGVKYKWGKNFLLLDLRYTAGLKNVTNKKYNYRQDKETWGLAEELSRYANVSDYFRVNSFTFSFGFMRPLYDPRKVDKPRTKSVSRKLSKE